MLCYLIDKLAVKAFSMCISNLKLESIMATEVHKHIDKKLAGDCEEFERFGWL